MAEVFDTLLLLALPASGKSETRNYLTHRDPEGFHMGPTVQLDDYPYVHLQNLIDEALAELGHKRVFHVIDDGGQRNGPFAEPTDIAGLVYLLNEDYQELLDGKPERPESAAKRLFERFDAASEAAGATAKLRGLSDEVLGQVAAKLEPEARKFYDEKAANCPDSLDGKTVVIEFARGGPEGAGFPLADGFGYLHSLRHLSPAILASAGILYIWVDPEESRRKNRERADPDGGAGSILFHGTPESVMYREYGVCDMAWLIEQSDVPNAVRVERAGQTFHVPVSRFDNRNDLTTFLRKDVKEWAESEIQAIHTSLRAACDVLWTTYGKLGKGR